MPPTARMRHLPSASLRGRVLRRPRVFLLAARLAALLIALLAARSSQMGDLLRKRGIDGEDIRRELTRKFEKNWPEDRFFNAL